MSHKTGPRPTSEFSWPDRFVMRLAETAKRIADATESQFDRCGKSEQHPDSLPAHGVHSLVDAIVAVSGLQYRLLVEFARTPDGYALERGPDTDLPISLRFATESAAMILRTALALQFADLDLRAESEARHG